MFACAGKTEPPSRLILSQTSGEVSRIDQATSSRAPHLFDAHLALADDQAAWAVAISIPVLASKFRPWARTLQAMRRKRAVALASAIASTLGCSRFLGRFNPGLEPVALPALRLDQHDPCRHCIEQDAQVAIAARLDILHLQDVVRQVGLRIEALVWGTSPSQAPKSRPFENTSPRPIAATIALEMIGPMPGQVLISRSQSASLARNSLDLAR